MFTIACFKWRTLIFKNDFGPDITSSLKSLVKVFRKILRILKTAYFSSRNKVLLKNLFHKIASTEIVLSSFNVQWIIMTRHVCTISLKVTWFTNIWLFLCSYDQQIRNTRYSSTLDTSLRVIIAYYY